MKIDPDIAKAILFEEAVKAGIDPGSASWAARFEELDRLCGKIARTHIAALGTALLAKAVDVNVDVYSLKRTRNGPRAYVARALAKDVLAAHAPQLEIDIGVYGREPLNNQPYFRESRISREMPVKANARPALSYLVDILDLLDRVETEERAREALRTYIRVRRGHFRRPVGATIEGAIPLNEFLAKISSFTESGSEGGKRAQAIVAGVLDVSFGAQRVRTNRVNDPDRNLPADVGITSSDASGWERIFEVRDKPVSEPDLHHLLAKAAEAEVERVGMLALAARQPAIDIQTAVAKAAGQGVTLSVTHGWQEFVAEALFWGGSPVADFGRATAERVDQRLIDLEASPETLAAWRALFEPGGASDLGRQ